MAQLLVQCAMKIDGRTLDHATLEQIRLMAIRRVREGEDPGVVITSYGFNRTTIYKSRRPLQQGEKLAGRIDQQLADVRDDPKLVRSFFDAPSVAYIRDC